MEGLLTSPEGKVVCKQYVNVARAITTYEKQLMDEWRYKVYCGDLFSLFWMVVRACSRPYSSCYVRFWGSTPRLSSTSRACLPVHSVVPLPTWARVANAAR